MSARQEFINAVVKIDEYGNYPVHPNDERIRELYKELRPLEEEIRSDIVEAVEIASEQGERSDALNDYLYDYAYSNNMTFEYGRFWQISNC